MAEGASLGGETIATALTTTTLKETPEITFISELHHQIPLSIIHNTVLRSSKQLTNMQLPTRGGHGRGWSRRRGRGRVKMQPTQSSENTSDSDPRNKQHDDNEVGRQQSAVEDGVETQKTPVCGQVDDRCAEAVLWSQSRTELNTYCDEDANEYVVRPRVCLPGPNLNGNDEKLGRNHKIEQHCILIGLETLTDGIGWQSRPERKWLANLLANEQAVAPLLKYLMTTEVGSRGGETDRETEWEQRADQAGEELLNR